MKGDVVCGRIRHSSPKEAKRQFKIHVLNEKGKIALNVFLVLTTKKR